MIKHHNLLSSFCCALTMASSTNALAADEPVEEAFLLDGELNAFADNPELKDDVFVDGSTLVIRIDPSQLFGAIGVQQNQLAFDPANAPPELGSFYFAGVRGGFSIRPGTCTKDQPATATTPSIPCTEQRDIKGWELEPKNLLLYQCQLPEKQSLTSLVKTSASWSLVQQGAGGALTCMENYALTLGPAFTGGQLDVVLSGEKQAPISLKQVGKYWEAEVPLQKGSTRITVRIKRGQTTEFVTLPPFKVKEPTTPSRVRIQAELLTTNQGRAVSYAVAITPVREAFFTQGPWNCFLLCTISPTLIFRLSGEEATNFQVGAGVAVFVNRAFQINGGLLVGTKDLASRWKPENSWFLGIGVDPFILADAQATAATAAAPKGK
ncbi:MAG: hypothetical protein IPM54_31085 [Polyangiaceae bacterium]|nr:hypothetical protein [Polyangiaceae bacterium]